MNKFDVKPQNGLFIRYILNDSCYSVYNLKTIVEKYNSVILHEVKLKKELVIDYNENDNIVSDKLLR